jgi:hypothetical protein
MDRSSGWENAREADRVSAAGGAWREEEKEEERRRLPRREKDSLSLPAGG